MRVGFAIPPTCHGAIHVAGFLEAFGLAELPQLGHALSRPAGVLWLLAGLGFVASAVLLFVDGRHWWMAAAPALLQDATASWRWMRVVSTTPLASYAP